MEYEGIVIRPPSEAGSLILQATFGCSHNKCSFCPTYKGTRFRIKDQARLEAEIDEMAGYGPRWSRVFLADGDALIIPQDRLVRIFDKIAEKMPWIERVGIYANAKSVLRKSVDELKELRDRKLGIAYFGLETGDEDLLKEINKGSTTTEMIEAARRVKAAGILLSVTVLLGIAGKGKGAKHALATAKVLSEMDPDFIGALTVMVVPNTPLFDKMERGEYELPDAFDMLEELGLMISHTTATDCLFASNHASNYLPIKARLPREQESAVRAIARVLAKRDRAALKPEFLRAL